MKKPLVYMILVTVGMLATTAVAQKTLREVKARGTLMCGVNTQFPGFAQKGADGQWRGFDVDFCRALAAAIFNDARKVTFKPFTTKQRFLSFQSGGADVLSRNTTWTLTRDASYGFDFGPTLFYDGQGMMVRKALGMQLARAGAGLVQQSEQALSPLNGVEICVQVGTTSEANLKDFFRQQRLTYVPVRFKVQEDMFGAYDRGACEVATSDISQLTARRATLTRPSDHVILGVLMSKEPLGPVVRHNDRQWYDTIKWIAFGLIQAEEYGITSANIDRALSTEDPARRRFLGLDGRLGAQLGLSPDFMVRVIRQVGNYREIFERNLQPLGLQRGPNALWNKGGLLFSPPFR